MFLSMVSSGHPLLSPSKSSTNTSPDLFSPIFLNLPLLGLPSGPLGVSGMRENEILWADAFVVQKQHAFGPSSMCLQNILSFEC